MTTLNFIYVRDTCHCLRLLRSVDARFDSLSLFIGSSELIMFFELINRVEGVLIRFSLKNGFCNRPGWTRLSLPVLNGKTIGLIAKQIIF